MTRLTDGQIITIASKTLNFDSVDARDTLIPFARAIEAELAKQEPVAWIIARETAFDLPGGGHKELGYIVPHGSVAFPTQEAAHEAHREMQLPLGWVVMRTDQLYTAPLPEPPDTVRVPPGLTNSFVSK